MTGGAVGVSWRDVWLGGGGGWRGGDGWSCSKVDATTAGEYTGLGRLDRCNCYRIMQARRCRYHIRRRGRVAAREAKTRRRAGREGGHVRVLTTCFAREGKDGLGLVRGIARFDGAELVKATVHKRFGARLASPPNGMGFLSRYAQICPDMGSHRFLSPADTWTSSIPAIKKGRRAWGDHRRRTSATHCSNGLADDDRTGIALFPQKGKNRVKKARERESKGHKTPSLLAVVDW